MQAPTIARTLAAALLAVSRAGHADILYSSVKLISGTPAGMTWNAYGVGYASDTASAGSLCLQPAA